MKSKNIIPENVALGLIKAGKAKAEGLVHRDDNGARTYVAVSRYDTQETAHVLVGYGHLDGTSAGSEIEAKYGIGVVRILSREGGEEV